MSSAKSIHPIVPRGTFRLEAPSSGPAERLARFRTAGAELRGARDFLLPLEQLEGHGLEAWWLQGGVTPRTAAEDVQAVAAGGLLLCEAHDPDASDPRDAAKRLYERLLSFVAANGYPHVVKGWNYLEDINEGPGDQERYKQFCVGRGEVLDSLWVHDYLPAGTGVGSGSGTGLRVTLLASREQPDIIENPRQTSAYRYPRQYGPKSPSFSRAAAIGGAGDRLLFISGTAAIVGHDSLHVASVEGQIEETLRNWQSLFDAYEKRHGVRPSFEEDGCYRVYLRRPEHLAVARRLLGQAGFPLQRTLFLRADICRRELLFEMDAVIATS
jgi:chorismate lyase/3-hydroxybenzoate synthase